MFAKEDAQTESFIQAAERGGYHYGMCKSSEEAMELYLASQPEVLCNNKDPFTSILSLSF